MYQLFIIHSGKEGQDASHKDVVKAYDYLMDAIINGVTFFDEAISYFKENFDQLAPHYVKSKKLPVEVKEESKKEILNMHDAFIGELKVAFSAALGKDRLYHRPCGFLNDQQIWMVGVQLKYMFDKVLRFNHSDFIKAIKIDLGPILGDFGAWSAKCHLDKAKESGDSETKKKYQVILDVIEKYMETGLDVLSDEKKYNFMNKFGPKKCPNEQVKREDI